MGSAFPRLDKKLQKPGEPAIDCTLYVPKFLIGVGTEGDVIGVSLARTPAGVLFDMRVKQQSRSQVGASSPDERCPNQSKLSAILTHVVILTRSEKKQNNCEVFLEFHDRFLVPDFVLKSS